MRARVARWPLTNNCSKYQRPAATSGMCSLPDAVLGGLPAREHASAAEYRVRPGCGLIGDRRLGRAAVERFEHQRFREGIGSVGDVHGHRLGQRAFGLQRPDRVPCSAQRGQRFLGRARVGVIAAGGNMEIGGRRGRRGDGKE